MNQSPSNTGQKTIPIQDVGIFLGRLLFAPLVVIFSYVVPIFFWLMIFLTFIATEIFAVILAPIFSLFWRRWLIKDWAKSIYHYYRDDGDWDTLERTARFPTLWWQALTEPAVRPTLSKTANSIALGILWLGNFLWVAAKNPSPTFWVCIFAAFGVFIAWLALWLTKIISEVLLRWIFQKPKPAAQTTKVGHTPPVA